MVAVVELPRGVGGEHGGGEGLCHVECGSRGDGVAGRQREVETGMKNDQAVDPARRAQAGVLPPHIKK